MKLIVFPVKAHLRYPPVLKIPHIPECYKVLGPQPALPTLIA